MSFPTIALGTWLLGGTKEADPHNDDEADKQIIRTAIDAGVRLIDTAQNYAAGKAETLVGEVLAEPAYMQKEVQVLTKHNRFKMESVDQVEREFHGSLARLGRDYIDYYLLHAPNPDVPIDNFFTAVNKLVAAGKIHHVGVSNCGVAMLEHAIELCETPIVVNQLAFSPTDRHIVESGLYNMCRNNDIVVQAYRPLVDSIKILESNKVAQAIANDRGITIAQLAVAWLSSNEGVALTVRASSKQHWEDIFEAADIVLDEDEIMTLMVSVTQSPHSGALELEALQPA